MRWQLLHHACWRGNAEEVRRLLDAGADPNQVAPTNWRQTPLGRTLEFRLTSPRHEGHLAVLKLLLERGADPGIRSTYLDMSPYELACFGGFRQAADLLQPYAGNSVPHPAGMSPLWLAAATRLEEQPMLEQVRRLLAAGADPNAIWRGATPLMMATGHAGHFEVAEALVAAGADANRGVSILHADWHWQHLLPALPYLHGKGWNVNGVDAQGHTALHRAAFCGYARAVRTLLALGADATARDGQGATPLDLARRAKKATVVKILQ